MAFSWPVLQYSPRGAKLNDSATADMQMDELSFEVTMNALLPTVSQSVMTMTFKNDHPVVLEGELQFTLPPDSIICGYGVDIAGEIVDGVPIEKQKAKVVFEKEVRKRTKKTPAIVELVKGEIFKTRVYPLPANGTRTVRLSYETQVSLTTSDTSNGEVVHVIPANISEGIKNLSVKVNCVGLPESTPPICEQVEGQDGEITFHWNDNGGGPGACGIYTGEVQKGEGDYGGPNADFKIVFPQTESVVAIENSEGSEAKVDEIGAYFCISDVVNLSSINSDEGGPGCGEGSPDVEGEGHEVKEIGETAPSQICVVWDASLSRDTPERSLEQDILKQLLSQGDWKDVQVTLVVLRNSLVPMNLSHDSVLDVIEKLDYDGATNLGALSFKKHLDEHGPFDFYILFSDGMANIGPEEPAIAEVPVYSVNGGGTKESNNAFLTYISEKSGGKYFDVGSGKHSAENVVKLLGKPSVRFLKAEFNEEDISLIPPMSSSSANSFVTVGLLKAEETTIKLSYGYKNAVVRSEVHTLKTKNAISSGGIVRRMWAKQRIAEMLPFPEKCKKELFDVGEKFGIVTPGTSFIVLESLEQHLEHEVVPARSRTKLYDEYMKQIEGKQQKKEQDMQQKIAKVTQLFNRRNTWHQRNFEKKKKKPSAGTEATSTEQKAPSHGTGEETLSGEDSEVVRQDAATSAPQVSTPPEATSTEQKAPSHGTGEETLSVGDSEVVRQDAATSAPQVSTPTKPEDCEDSPKTGGTLAQLSKSIRNFFRKKKRKNKKEKKTLEGERKKSRYEEYINNLTDDFEVSFSAGGPSSEPDLDTMVIDRNLAGAMDDDFEPSFGFDEPSFGFDDEGAIRRIKPHKPGLRSSYTNECLPDSTICDSDSGDETESETGSDSTISHTPSISASETRGRRLGRARCDSPQSTDDSPDGCVPSQREFASRRSGVGERYAEVEEADSEDSTRSADTASSDSSGSAGSSVPERKTPQEGEGESGPAIQVQAWDPKTPYLDQIKGTADPKNPSEDELLAYQMYLKIRKHYEKSPSFYFDVSSFFEQTHKNLELAVRILTNVLELSLDNAQLLRTVAYKFVELELYDSAAGVFEKVLRLRPEEPQSYRDLALILSTPGTNVHDSKRSLRLFDDSILGTWDSRFEEIELTTLMELAHAAEFNGFDVGNLAAKPGIKTPANIIKLFNVDLRISLAWDTDDTDVDLHVIEPTGEECYYSNKSTRIGGSLSRDFTRGLGPEEYILKKATPGEYKIMAKYFANHRQSLTGATTLLVTVFKHYGDKETEEKTFVSMRLSSNKQKLHVATVKFP